MKPLKNSAKPRRAKRVPTYQYVDYEDDKLLESWMLAIMVYKTDGGWIPVLRDLILIILEKLMEERRQAGKILAVPVSVLMRKYRWLIDPGTEVYNMTHLYHEVALNFLVDLEQSNFIKYPAPGYVVLGTMGRERLANRRKVTRIMPMIKQFIQADADVTSSRANDASYEKERKFCLRRKMADLNRKSGVIHGMYVGGEVPIYRRILRKKKGRKVAKDKRKL